MTLGSPVHLTAVLPELVLLVAGCVVLLLAQSTRERKRVLVPWVALAAQVGALALVLVRRELAGEGSGLMLGSLAQFVRLAALEVGVLLTLVNWNQARLAERGEYLSLLLFALCGLLLSGSADNLLVLFLALELVSIPTYVMVVLSRSSLPALEAGTKYFYLGALSAAIMAYGFSFLYGVSGTADLSDVQRAVVVALTDPGSLRYGLALVGITLSLGGLLFKIAAVPLHFYVADVYHGAASPVAGVLGFVPKLAGFIAIFKLITLTGHWHTVVTPLYWLLWIVAVASMSVGNMLALRQTNIKRLLAYSGIAHAGYMLVGVIAGPFAGEAGYGVMGSGTAAVLYYVVIYGIANLAAFAVLGLLRVRDGACETLGHVAGLLRRHPGLAWLLVLAIFTLMGLPPTPGFWGKLSLFGSALAAAQTAPLAAHDTSLIVLVIIALLNSALAAAYYLRVIAAILLYENPDPCHAAGPEAPHIGTLLCGFLLLILMFYPSGLMSASRAASVDVEARVAVVTTPQSEAGARAVALGPGQGTSSAVDHQ